jgi:hypothetical protein
MSNILVATSRNKNKITHQVLDLEGHYFLQYEESVREIIAFLANNTKGKTIFYRV